MKKIIYLILMMMMISCTSHRKISESSSIETTDKTSLISKYLEKTLAEDIQIEWSLDDDTLSYQIANSAIYRDSIKPPLRKPPKKGKIHIRIAKKENITSQHIKQEKKVQTKIKQRTEDKRYTKPSVKKKSSNLLINSIIIIIFGLIVKFLFSHKNKLKKVWKKIKNSLTLRHP